jgi:putative transposase
LVTLVRNRTVANVDSIVIWSPAMSVFDVRHAVSGSLVLRAGRGYLQPSRRQSLRRQSACYTGGFAGLVA